MIIRLAIAFALTVVLCVAEELPIIDGIEFQPFAAQVSRVLQALEVVGEPMPAADAKELQQLVERGPASAKTLERMQRILDKYALAGIEINPESRVKVQQGQAPAALIEQGWRAFLLKVNNQAGITP